MRHRRSRSRCHRSFSMLVRVSGLSACWVSSTRLRLVALTMSSGIGDTPFKQPPEFTRRILYNLFLGGHDTSPWEDLLVRNLTPPYISAMPEVTHYPLGASQKRLRRYLVLASDGFTDICGEAQRSVIERWLQCVESGSECCETDNMALKLLWQGLGGDVMGVSKMLTLDMDVPWLDDVSIVVQSL